MLSIHLALEPTGSSIDPQLVFDKPQVLLFSNELQEKSSGLVAFYYI